MYEVAANQARKIVFKPSSKIEEILQNVAHILSTPKTDVCYFNEFSVDWSLLDRPINEVEGILSASIIKAISKYEPRFRIQTIEYKGDPINGIIQPIVKGLIDD